MADDIQISNLNEITCNNDLNFIIVNQRENAAEQGITKKIQLGNLLTDGLITNRKLADGTICGDKIAGCTVTASNIEERTITSAQIANCGITSINLGPNSVNNFSLDNCKAYTTSGLLLVNGCLNVNHQDGCIDISSGVTRLNGVRYTWPGNDGPPNYYLKTNGSGGLVWSEAVPGNGATLVFDQIVPVGTIIPWAGTSTVPDDKWLECDGGRFDGTQYPDLSAALGLTWGGRFTAATAGSRDDVNGKFFTLPDFRGRVPVGVGTGTDVNGTACQFNKTDSSGEYSHQLSIGEMPAHIHGVSQIIRHTGCAFDNALFDQGVGGASEGITTDTTGGSEYHNNIQPYVATNFLIKAKLDDVQQFSTLLGSGLSARDIAGTTSNLTLTSTHISIKSDEEQFKFSGSGELQIKDPVLQASPILGSVILREEKPNGSSVAKVAKNNSYLRSYPVTTSCINYAPGGSSFVCTFNGNAGLGGSGTPVTYYPENQNTAKDDAGICIQQPGIYELDYTGAAIEFGHLAHACVDNGSATSIAVDIDGNEVRSLVNGNRASGEDESYVTFKQIVHFPEPGKLFIYQTMGGGAGRMGYSYPVCVNGVAKCTVWSDLKITRHNHYLTSITPTTASMCSVFG